MQAEYERVFKVLGTDHNDKVNTNDDIFSIYVPYSRGAMRLYYGEKEATT